MTNEVVFVTRQCMQSTDFQRTMALRALEKQVSNLVALKVSKKGIFVRLISSQIICFFVYERTDNFALNRMSHFSVVILLTAQKLHFLVSGVPFCDRTQFFAVCAQFHELCHMCSLWVSCANYHTAFHTCLHLVNS